MHFAPWKRLGQQFIDHFAGRFDVRNRRRDRIDYRHRHLWWNYSAGTVLTTIKLPVWFHRSHIFPPREIGYLFPSRTCHWSPHSLDYKVLYADNLPDVVSHLFDTGSDTGRRTRRLLQPRKTKRIDQGNLFRLFPAHLSLQCKPFSLMRMPTRKHPHCWCFLVSTPQTLYTCRSIDINGGGAVRNFKLLIRK